MKKSNFISNFVYALRKRLGWCPEPPTRKIEKVQGDFESYGTPKTELSLNLPPIDVFGRLLNYFETRSFGSINFSDIKKNLPSRLEGKWRVPPAQLVGGNFKIDITANNDESKVKVNVDSWKINRYGLICFFAGLFMFLIFPPALLGSLFLFCYAIIFFAIGRWWTGKILREINELLSNIPETTEKIEEAHEEVIREERKTVEITETLEGFNVNLPEKDVFNQLVDYFGADVLKQKIPFSHIEGRWTFGPFKIDIVPNNGKSQVKTNFSCFYINLLAFSSFVLSIAVLLISGWFVGTGGLLGAPLLLILGLWLRQNATKRLKELFQTRM